MTQYAVSFRGVYVGGAWDTLKEAKKALRDFKREAIIMEDNGTPYSKGEAFASKKEGK